MPSGPEAFIVLAVIILLFGAKKLPELAGSVGKSIKAFRKETDRPDDAPVDADADSEA
jgi:sec-independent protein translocase protein TatA